MSILNLTQHRATPEHLDQGVVDPDSRLLMDVRDLLDFQEIPLQREVQERAERLADLAGEYGFRRAMIGGAPFLMGPLERALHDRGILAVYAFSRRESVESTEPDGTVRKTSVFRHEGFYLP